MAKTIGIAALKKAGADMRVSFSQSLPTRPDRVRVSAKGWRKVDTGKSKTTFGTWTPDGRFSVNVYVPNDSDLVAELSAYPLSVAWDDLNRGEDYTGKGRHNAGETMEKYTLKTRRSSASDEPVKVDKSFSF